YVEEIGHPGRWSSQNFSMSALSSNELSYTLYSESLDDLEQSVVIVEEVMKGNEQLKDVYSTREESYEAFTFHVDQATLLQHGLTTAQIVMMLYPDTSKEVLTTVESDGNKVEVIVQKEVVTPESVEDMLKLPVQSVTGAQLTLGDLVEVEEGYALNTLARSKGQFYASVSGTILGDDVSKASSEVDKEVNELE